MACGCFPLNLPFPDGQEECTPIRLAVLRREEVWGARGCLARVAWAALSAQCSGSARLGSAAPIGVAALVSAAAAPSEHRKSRSCVCLLLTGIDMRSLLEEAAFPRGFPLGLLFEECSKHWRSLQPQQH